MKKILVFIFIIIFFSNIGFSAKINLFQQKKQIKQMKKNLLKLYFCTLVVEKMFPYKSLNVEDTIKLKILEETLSKSLEYLNRKEKFLSKEIKKLQKKKELEKVRREIIEEVRKRLEKEGITDPLSGARKIPKSYTFQVKSPKDVYAPFSGKISEIGIRGESVFIKLKGKKCNATITGIDELEVSMGKPIKEGQVIGKIFRVPKKFEFFIECKKSKISK